MGWRELNARWRRLQRHKQTVESERRYRVNQRVGQEMAMRQRGAH
jgi:hypothetical protein